MIFDIPRYCVWDTHYIHLAQCRNWFFYLDNMAEYRDSIIGEDSWSEEQVCWGDVKDFLEAVETDYVKGKFDTKTRHVLIAEAEENRI